jgi:hypothetical protein
MNQQGGRTMNSDNKPHALLGSGRLTSSLWKIVNQDHDVEYRFNVFRIHGETGAVDQWLAPEDIESLVKLSRVLAFELAEDGCMDRVLRERLYQLAERLDELIEQDS